MPQPGTDGERIQRPATRIFVRPIVTEVVPVLEPVGRDPFLD
jgi:hypothetical protein